MRFDKLYQTKMHPRKSNPMAYKAKKAGGNYERGRVRGGVYRQLSALKKGLRRHINHKIKQLNRKRLQNKIKS